MPAQCPSAIAQEIPISTPDFEVRARGGHRVKEALSARVPPSHKSEGAAPPRILGRQWAMDLIAISEWHIDERLAESPHSLSVHKTCSRPAHQTTASPHP